MQRIIGYFNSRIRFKVILPYAILTLIVASAGVYISTRLVSESLEERFSNQLLGAATLAADGLTELEDSQLEDLRSVIFTEGMLEAVITDDRQKLQALLFPLMANKKIDRVDIIDSEGQHYFGIRRPLGSNNVEDYKVIKNGDETDWSNWRSVQNVLNGITDSRGDKYITIEEIDGQQLFFTAGPLKQGDDVVGAVMVSSYLSDVLRSLRQITFADVSLYDLEGDLINTTFPNKQQAADLLSLGPEARSILAVDGESSFKKTISLEPLEYDVIYNVFRARGEPVGFYSVALQTTFIISHGATARNQMVFIFASTLLGVFLIGYYTANLITRPVQHLMENALAVASGDFTRRTEISSSDEIGSLARSLDHMTENLANYTSNLQSRIDELILLYESSTAVTVKSGLNLSYIPQAIAENVHGVMQGVGQTVVYLFDENSQEFVPQSSNPENMDDFGVIPLAERGEFSALIREGRPQGISAGKIENFWVNESAAQNNRLDVIIVPLIAGREIVGMLSFIPDLGQQILPILNEDMERLLVTLASPAAIAIKNAQLFEATQQAYEELRQLDDLKTEFINIAAHELRTPLGAMMGYASFIEKRVPPKLHKSTRFLIASSLRMRTMVDAMLAIQRLDAGTAFIRITDINIRDVIKKVVADFEPMAELEGHTIEVNLPDKLPLAQADGEKVGLILSNLVSNAIKFTPEGGRIEIRARDYIKGILVSVQDNGVGISPEDQAKIFERFYQVRPEHLAGHGGMGIGLTIVKHLVELHEGQVWVESEEGKGTTFSFTLPRTEAETNNGASTVSSESPNSPAPSQTTHKQGEQSQLTPA